MRVVDILEAFGHACCETLGAKSAAIRFRDATGTSRDFLVNPHPSPLAECDADRTWSYAQESGVATRDLRSSGGDAILLDFRGRSDADPTIDSGIDEDALDILASVTGLSLEKSFHIQRVENLAQIDSVTGLFNRRSLDEIFATECDRARRMSQPLSVVMIDIDHFKKINDTYGHAAGDLVLRAVADALRRTLRDIDVVARYGGEEFAVLLPETNLEKAAVAAERMRAAVEDLLIRVAKPGCVMSRTTPLIDVTISLGVVADTGRSTPLSLLAAADQALYRAKRNGRNRYEIMENSSVTAREFAA